MSRANSKTLVPTTYQRRVDRADWAAVAAEVDELGCGLTPELITPAEAAKLAGLYDHDEAFRSTVDMGRHRFGEGEYRYLAHPLPEIVEQLRQALYPRLLPIARDWYAKFGRRPPWPETLDEWLDMCHAAGQTKPTPLILKYGPGGWNALHRDLYGDLVFPLQVVINLTEPGTAYAGGEFVLVEQRPTGAVTGHVRFAPPWLWAGVHYPRPARPVPARLVGGTCAPWGIRRPFGPPLDPGPAFPRCGITGRHNRAARPGGITGRHDRAARPGGTTGRPSFNHLLTGPTTSWLERPSLPAGPGRRVRPGRATDAPRQAPAPARPGAGGLAHLNVQNRVGFAWLGDD